MVKNIAILVLLFVVFLYSIRCSVLIDANEELKFKCRKNAKVIDSLNSEIWIKDVQIGRCENVLDIIEEKNQSLVGEALLQTE